MPAGPAAHDWYGILGVDPSANDAEIGRAFRALARRFHPDVGPDPSDTAFSEVARAWEVLGNPLRRAVEVVVPQDPSEAERAALEALARVERGPRDAWPAASRLRNGRVPTPGHPEEEPEDQKGETHVDDAI